MLLINHVTSTIKNKYVMNKIHSSRDVTDKQQPQFALISLKVPKAQYVKTLSK